MGTTTDELLWVTKAEYSDFEKKLKSAVVCKQY